MARIRILEQPFRNTLNRALRKESYIDTAARNARSKFDAGVRDAIKVFEQHPVTKELSNEKGSSKVFERGNVAAVLGIYEGDGFLLLQQLRMFLESPLTFVLDTENPKFTNRKSKGVLYEFGVIVPSLKDFYNATPAESGVVEWSLTSWTELLEKGVPRFGGMIYSKTKFGNSERSRSKQAIQRKGSGFESASPISYVTDIRNAFFKRLGL